MKFIYFSPLVQMTGQLSPKEIMMNAVKSFFAIAVLAFSANVSAQIVFVPDFPAKKAVETVNAEQKAPASEAVDQAKVSSKKAA